MKYFYLIIVSMITMYFFGCSTVKKDIKAYREDVRKNKMSRLAEDNLNDDLNATERAAVDPIFEKNRKERERTDKAIFGVLDPEE